MVEIFRIIQALEQEWLIRVLTSIFICGIIWAIAPFLTYIIVKILSIKSKKQDIKKKPFYKPLIYYFRIYAIYFGFMFFGKILNPDLKIIQDVKDIYFVLSAFLIARVFAKGFAQNSQMQITLEKKYPKLDNNMISIILKIIRVVIYIIAFLVVLKYFKFDLSGLIAGLGLGGVILTIATQDAAKNIIASFMVILDKPFSVGDWIKTSNYEGTVEEITFRSVRIRAFDNSIILIPNSQIADDVIINYSKMYQRRYQTTLTLELSTPLEKVDDFCKNVLEQTLKIQNTIVDGSYCKFDSISDDGIVILYTIFLNTLDTDKFRQLKQDVNFTIMNVLEKMQINLAYNSQTIYIQK